MYTTAGLVKPMAPISKIITRPGEVKESKNWSNGSYGKAYSGKYPTAYVVLNRAVPEHSRAFDVIQKRQAKAKAE